VAKDLHMSQATVGAIERGDRVPGLDVLSRLAVLYEPDEDARLELLSRWLVKWVERKVEAVGAGPSTDAALLRRAAAGLAETLSTPARAITRFPCSLEDFPERFQPLVAVFPDRREVPPDSPADLFIRSGAVTDFQFLPLLRGMTEPLTICSDKFFVLMKEDWLRERFSGHHLLVVGSSGVNWLTRSLAGTAIFRPLIEPTWRAWDRDYRDTDELDDHRMLGVFWRLMERAQYSVDGRIDPDAVPTNLLGPAQRDRLPRATELARRILGGTTESNIVQQFRVPGFADPADGERHGRLPGENTDFAVLSLAPHPFDDSGEFFAIVVAGISGPGTAHGLKALLTEQPLFVEHPFGGVIKVHLPAREEGWPGRFEKADWIWQTGDYTPAKVLANLRQARATPDGPARRPAFQGWDDKAIESTVAFVERLTTGGARQASDSSVPSAP
jgi:transcriptional regulator with XRE-family HTH domain